MDESGTLTYSGGPRLDRAVRNRGNRGGLRVAGPQPGEVGSLLAAGASALTQQGDLRAARQRFDAAYRMAERVGDEPAMALAALGMGGLWVHEHRMVAGSALLQERLRRALSTTDPRSALALRLGVRLAGEADYSTGDSATILAALDQARASSTWRSCSPIRDRRSMPSTSSPAWPRLTTPPPADRPSQFSTGSPTGSTGYA